MGMAAGGSSDGVRSEINITPLVDVVLVLLIIFMVVTPELQRGKEVHLPLAESAAQRKDGGDPIVVSVKADRSLYIEQDEAQPNEISDKIKQILEVTPGRSVLIKGDNALAYGDVRNLINSIRRAGANNVSLAATVPEKK
jgi:biopolymer transport protein ExbD